MAHIKVVRGLDIPIKGKPTGNIQKLVPGGEAEGGEFCPKQIALDLDPFPELRFRLLVKEGDVVKIGQPLVEDKATDGRVFVSPAAGVIHEVRRGLKRRLLDMVINVADEEKYHEIDPLDPKSSPRESIIEKLKAGGLFAHIRQRPFNLLADPHQMPRSIFVKAVETAPFVPPAEMQIEGNEKDFQLGLDVLAKLTEGKVHLVYRTGSTCSAFTNAKGVETHTVEGPHPAANQSVHIQKIDPIFENNDIVWTLTSYDVIVIGHLLRTGRYFIDKVVSIAGPGILSGKTGFFKLRAGYPVEALISGRISKEPTRYITGDPLMGKKVKNDGFLGFYDFSFCAIEENVDRQMLHFFRLGSDKYSFSGAYASGHFDNSKREYDFTTNQHGEHRAFIDPTQYDKVMPVSVPTMQLVKAVMAEDFDLAEELGLLSIAPEDFALPTFVCPSKMEMTEIVKDGLAQHASEVLE